MLLFRTNILYPPPWKKHNRPNGIGRPPALLQEISEPPGLRTSLSQMLIHPPAVVPPKTVAVVDDLRIATKGLTKSLGFNRVNPGWTGDDVIDVEVRTRDIVKHLISLGAKLLKCVTDRPFPFTSQPEVGHLSPMPGYGPCSEGKYWHRNESNEPGMRCETDPPSEPFKEGENDEHAGEQEPVIKSLRKTRDLLVYGLSGDAKRWEPDGGATQLTRISRFGEIHFTSIAPSTFSPSEWYHKSIAPGGRGCG